MTFEEMTNLISSCVNAEGKPLTIDDFVAFSEHREKTLSVLYAYINDEKEVELYRDKDTHRLTKTSVAVRTMIRDRKTQLALKEVGRKFSINDYKERLKKHGTSETKIRDETIPQCVVRGFWQELGIIVHLSELKQTLPALLLKDQLDIHESSVYYGTVNHVYVSEFEWYPFERSMLSLAKEILSAAREPELFIRPRFLQLLCSLWNRYVLWLSFRFRAGIVIREKTGEKIYTRWLSY